MVDFPTRSDGEVLTAEQLNSYLDAIEANDAAITSHASSQANPHGVTKAQVGLGSVDNTSDANKPISTATQAALNAKANASHTHVATTDLTATGTKSSSTFLRGDNTWATPPNTTYAALSQAEAEAGTATTARTIDAARLKASIIYHAPVQVGHTHVVSDLTNFAASVAAHADVSANTAARHDHSNKAVLDAITASYTTAEKSKLSGIEAGADVTDAANVNAAGAVMNTDTTTAAMSFVVDEDAMTSDSATKVPTQQSVKAYVDSGLSGKANTSHTHTIANVTGLQTALDGKAASGHDHDATYAAISHAHDDRYYTETEVDTFLSGKASSSHTHTIANVTGLQTALDGKAASSHTHDDRYYTETETNTLLGGKANTSHSHAIGDVTGLQGAIDGKAASSHVHAINDITATGTPSSSTYLRGDGQWTTPTNTTYTLITQAEAENSSSTSTRLVSGQRLAQAVLAHAPVKAADLATKADATHTHTVANITDFASSVASHTDVAANTAARHTHSNAAVLNGTTASYTTAEKTKLSGIAAGAEVNVNADWDATSGDAQILNKPTTMPPSAHSHPTSEVTGLDTALSGKANTSHTHAVTDITATGRTSSNYLRGDGTWATPTNTTYSAITQAEAENAASTTARLVTGQRLSQAVLKHAPVKAADLATKADTSHTHGVSDFTATGTRNSSTFLRGDNTWKTLVGEGVVDIATAQPASPAAGTLWWDSDEPSAAEHSHTVSDIVDIDSQFYRATAVDALVEGTLDTINLRRAEFPLVAGRPINAITHGVGKDGTTQTVNVGSGQIRGALIYIGEDVTITKIGVMVASPAAGASIRLGVGSYDFSTNQATLVLDAGAVPASAAGAQTISVSQAISPGWYVLMLCPSATVGVQVVEGAGGYEWDPTNGRPLCSPVQTGSAYGAFGATDSMNTSSNYTPTTWIEVA